MDSSLIIFINQCFLYIIGDIIMGFGDLLGNIKGLEGLDLNKIVSLVEQLEGNFKNLTTVTNGSAAAFNSPDAPKTKFAKITNAIDKVVKGLQFLQGLKKVNAAPVQTAISAGTDIQNNLQDVKKDLLAGNIRDHADLKDKIGDVLGQYKDQIKPLAGLDLSSLI